MIDPKPIRVVQKPYPAGFRQAITFEAGSADTVSLRIKSRATLNIFEIENVATWTITVNSIAGAITNANVRNYPVSDGDSLIITITRTNPAAQSKFTIGATVFGQANTDMTLLNYNTNLGGDARYMYVIKGGTLLLCIDTSLTTTSNLKSITSIVNNGTSLTMTVASHGFSNGNTVSVLDVGGFSSDITHIPYVISNVTTNTFDITVTVTGTWDTLGKLMGAWTTNPEIASITLPTVSLTSFPWTHLAYRATDKTMYVFGTGAGGSSIAYACTVDADPASGGFNTVKNWDKSVSNTATNIGVDVSTAPDSVMYDSIRDRFVIVSNSGTYYISTGTAVPTKNYLSAMRTSTRIAAFFAYASQAEIFGASNVIFSYNPTIAGVANVVGVTFSGFVYSQKYSAFWYKTNSTGNFVKRSADDSLTQISSVASGSSTWNAAGCAVDPLDRLYFLRSSGSFSYGVTHDCIIYDHVANTREDVYIPLQSSGANTISKAIYSNYSGKVYAQDSGSSACRIHIFDTTRASGKKYIGYVNVASSCQDILINNLMWL